MRIVPTRKFWAFLALGIGLALLGAVVPHLESVVLPFDIGLVVTALITAYMTSPASNLRFARRYDSVLSVRVPNRVELELTNESQGSIRGRLADGVPWGFGIDLAEFSFDLRSGGVAQLSYHVTPVQRGSSEFGDVSVRLLAPLGLVEVERIVPLTESVRVYPNVLALRQFDLLKQRGRLSLMGIRRTRIKGQGTEFESLRDYHEDDIRRVDWKSTARRGKLVVRDYETERNQSVIVCIDSSRCMLTEVDGVSKLDRALDASLMLMHAAASEGDLTGVLIFGDRVQKFIPPRKGRGQNGAILDAIHNLYAQPIESDYVGAFSYLGTRWKRRSLIVVFTDCEDESQAKRLTAGLASLGKRHIVMVVRVRDPKIQSTAAMPTDDDRDLFKKAAALWYLSDRQRADTALKSVGLQNIDAEPDDLAQALVSAYLVVKETGAL